MKGEEEWKPWETSSSYLVVNREPKLEHNYLATDIHGINTRAFRFNN